MFNLNFGRRIVRLKHHQPLLKGADTMLDFIYLSLPQQICITVFLLLETVHLIMHFRDSFATVHPHLNLSEARFDLRCHRN